MTLKTFVGCFRRRRNNWRRAALQNDPRYCLDSDGRYHKQQHQYPLLLKPDQSTGSGQQYQGATASARVRNYTSALPAPPPPPPSFLLGTNQYAAYTPVDATGSILGAAHPISGIVSTSGSRRISAGGGDVTTHVPLSEGRRPYPSTQPVEHIYESPKFVRRGDGEADSYDDDVSVGDTGSGLRHPTSRQMVPGSTSSAVVTTFQ